jgi:hypothetical protein
MGDNDLMYHRVGAIGDPGAFAARARVPHDSALRLRADRSGWNIVSGDGITGNLGLDEIRISLLWKALTFSDRRAAREFDDHDDDLDVKTVVSVFRTDLARRGIRVDEPLDPFRDPDWSRALTRAYPPRR